MTSFQSMAMSRLGMPRSATFPPWMTVRMMSRKALGAPDISMATSKPSRMPRSRITSRRTSPPPETSTARVAPMRGAISRRAGFTSVTTTCRAPTNRATAAAMRPIGPAPVMSTSSPTRSKVRAVCTALPRGSRMAPTSSGMEGGSLKALVAGSEM